MNYDTKSPGVFIYDSFKFDYKTSFITAVVAEIEPIQYFRDRPLWLKDIDPTLAPAIKLTPKDLAEITGAPIVQDYLDSYEHILGTNNEFQSVVENILAAIRDASDIEVPSETPAAIGTTDVFTDVIEIVDAEGNVIRRIPKNEVHPLVAESEIELKEAGGENLADLGQFMENTKPTENIIELTDDEFQDNIDEAVEEIKDLLNDIPEESEEVVDSLEAAAELKEDNLPEGELPEVPSFEQLSEPIPQWYGIPIINLGPRDVPVKDSYILQVNTKRNWYLDITNVVGTGLDDQELRIPVVVPPATKFLAGVYSINNTISIFLKIEGDDKIYTKTMVTTEKLDMEAISYGIDNEGIKTLCGYLWDIWFWKTPEPFNTNLPNLMPEYPKHDTVFDFNTGRVQGHDVFPSDDYGSPAYNSGSWVTLPADWGEKSDLDNNVITSAGTDDWIFMRDGYLSKMFCRNHIKESSFSLIWYSWVDAFPEGIVTLVSDDIQSNYVRYNYDNNELMIDFNNHRFRQYVTLPEKVWGQYSLRYNKETGELSFAFRDFYEDLFEEAYLDIGNDLYFELMSLFGRFDKKQKNFVEIFKAISGGLIVSRNFKTTEELDELYQSTKPILKKYNMTEILNAESS